MKGTTIYFDFETGGVEDTHPNIQLAAVAVRDWKEVASFERKIQFTVSECDPEALTLNGYDADTWAIEAKPQPQVAKEFVSFLRAYADLELVSQRTGNPYKAARMAGHNVVAFDIPRLRRMMDAARVGWWPGCWWYPLDVYQRAIWHFAERGLEAPENYQLQTLAKHFEIPAQGAEHEALADVRLCARIAQVLTAEDF